MTRSTRLKANSGIRSDMSAPEFLNIDDIMYEILLRLPPDKFFYEQILVSKRWLEVISNPVFRHIYLTKWKPSFPPIGFFVCTFKYLGRRVDVAHRPRIEPSLPILSTSSLGDQIRSSGILKELGYYIDSSKGLLLCGRHPKVYYVWDSSTQKKQQLPRPRVHFEELCMALITEDCPVKGFSYKVIRAECVGILDQSPKVRVEIFSSKSTTWSCSELTCSESTTLYPWSPGRVIKGVVYWYAIREKVVIYDSNSEEKRIDLIELPSSLTYKEPVLGETADGCLQFGRSSKLGMMVWKLVKVNNVLQWKVLHKLNFEKMWSKNKLAMVGTQMLAFLDKRSDAVYIRCERKIYICDKKTGKVEVVKCQGQKSTLDGDSIKVVPFFQHAWISSLCLKRMS